MSEPAAEGEKTKKFEGPVAVEQTYKVDGRQLKVIVTFPGAVASEVGMEAVLLAANRMILTLESKNHKIEKVR